jgi:hypothetical protein
MRTLLATSFLFFSLTAGCAAQDASGSAESTDDALTKRVDDVSFANIEVSEGNAVSVSYAPQYHASNTAVPYLAVALAPAPSLQGPTEVGTQSEGALGGPVTVSVQGDFPGSPEVLVTDANFRVLARSAPHAPAAMARATVALPVVGAPKFILVRDRLWTKPMTFSVAVGR